MVIEASMLSGEETEVKCSKARAPLALWKSIKEAYKPGAR